MSIPVVARVTMLLFSMGLAVCSLFAQTPEIDATTPEGTILQRIGMAPNEAEKIRDMEEFLAKFPDHAGAAWVLAQQIEVFESRKEPEKVIGAAEKMLAKDPGNVRAGFAAMKAAEVLGDGSRAAKFAEAAHAACTKTMAAPMPADADEEQWKSRQDYARQIRPLTEYAFASLAGQATDAVVIQDYAERLSKLNTESEYLTAIRERQFLAARAASNQAMAIQAGEALANAGKANADALLYLAGVYLEGKSNPEKVVGYTDAALAALASAQKPEAVADDEWQKKLQFNKGLAHWIQGLHHANGQRWAATNKSLRAALPMIQGNGAMQAAAYFFLGIANFEIGKRSKDHKEVVDAVKFSEQCAAIASPYQAQAAKNVKAMRAQFRF